MSLVPVGRGAVIIAPISNDAVAFSLTTNSYSEGEQLPVAFIHHRHATVSVEASASCQHAVEQSDNMVRSFFRIAKPDPWPQLVREMLPSPTMGRFS